MQCRCISFAIIKDARSGYNTKNSQEWHKPNLNTLGNVFSLTLGHE